MEACGVLAMSGRGSNGEVHGGSSQRRQAVEKEGRVRFRGSSDSENDHDKGQSSLERERSNDDGWSWRRMIEGNERGNDLAQSDTIKSSRDHRDVGVGSVERSVHARARDDGAFRSN